MDDKFIIKDIDKEIANAMSSRDPGAMFAQLTKRAEEARQAASVSGVKATDPAVEAAKNLQSLNTQFGKYSTDALDYLKTIASPKLLTWMGLTPVIAATLGNVSSALVMLKSSKALRLSKTGGDAAAQAAGKVPYQRMGLNRPKTTFFEGMSKGVRGGMSNFAKATGLDKVGAGAKNLAIRADQLAGGIGSKAKAAGSALMSRIGSPKAMLGEGIFKLASLQEKIPLYGRFAKMFGAGQAIAKGSMANLTGVGAAGRAASPGLLGEVAGKAMLPLLIFTTALQSVGQALEAGANAADFFDTAQDKLAGHQIAAAESAGFLTGILNTLTFGIFDPWIGSAGSVTGWLARLIDQFPILNGVIQAVMFPLKILYGVLWGVWEVVKEVASGLWDGLSQALVPIGEAFTILWGGLKDGWNIIMDIFSPLNDMFKSFTGGIGIAESISSVFKSIGSVLGGFARGAGAEIASFFQIFVWGAKLAATVIRSFANLINSVLKPAVEFVKTIISWIPGFGGGTPKAGGAGAAGGGGAPAVAAAAGGAGTAVINPGGAGIGMGAQLGAWLASFLPHFAAGGIVSGPTMAMLGESGPEAVVPLDVFAPSGQVIPKPITDIETQVQQDHAGRQGNGASMMSAELHMISMMSQKQVSILAMQLEELREIKQSLMPGSRGAGNPSTRSKIKPQSSPDYHRFSFGQYGGNASKNIINDGV